MLAEVPMHPARMRPNPSVWLGAGLAVAAASLLVSIWLTDAAPRFSGEGTNLHRGDAARDKLVFTAADCSSCHATPGQADPLKLGGGLALASPFGTFRVPNISPDRADGIGSWTV